MDEFAFNSTVPIESSSQSPPPFPAEPARCLGCQADLSRIIASARFCPRCGRAIAAVPVIAVDEVDELPRWLEEIKSREASSPIVDGYAKALYRLGRRYEVGGEKGRNMPEAMRCYRKAARLGNVMAFARLAARCIDTPQISGGFANPTQTKAR